MSVRWHVNGAPFSQLHAMTRDPAVAKASNMASELPLMMLTALHAARRVLSDAKTAVLQLASWERRGDGSNAILLPADVTHGALKAVCRVRTTHLMTPDCTTRMTCAQLCGAKFTTSGADGLVVSDCKQGRWGRCDRWRPMRLSTYFYTRAHM